MMRSDSDILAALSARLPGSEGARALGRILRVESAWHQLHQDEFLSAFQANPMPEVLTASHLASLAIRDDLAQPLDLSLAMGDREPMPDQPLIKAAVQGLGLAVEARGSDLAAKVMQDADRWREPLAVTWPAVGDKQEVLRKLFSGGDLRHQLIAIHVLQANYPVERAADLLSEAHPAPGAELLTLLMDAGEIDLAKQMVFHKPGLSSSVAGTHVSALLLDAEKLQLGGEATEAYRALQSAWERATQQVSAVADRLAEFARLEGDPVLAVEAAQKAYEAEPTPERRARYAIELRAVGRAHVGYSLLPTENASLEEEIARGFLLRDQGREGEAKAALTRAVALLADRALLPGRWHSRLMEGLRQLGMIQDLLLAAQQRAQSVPWSGEARGAWAEILDYAGDPETAAAQARLALALSPESTAPMHTLAKSLAHSEEPTAASPYLEQLLAAGEVHVNEVAELALAAGAPELAERCCEIALLAEPDSPRAHTLEAKIKASAGAYQSALAQLAEVVRRDPHYLPARIALADAQAASGDQLAAGETLYAAAQAIPHHSAPKLSLARWLRTQNRLSEAFEVAHSAANLHPADPECLLEYGEIALELGQAQEAVEAFTRAHERQPANWRTALGLARAQESGQDFASALELIKALPGDRMDADDLIHAGRIAVRAAADADAKEGIAVGSALLERAEKAFPEGDPRIDLWQGLGAEAAGDPAVALERYQRSLPRFAGQDADLYQEALLGLSRAAIATRNLPLALSTLEQASERFPASLPVLELLSKAYLEANLPERSVEVAEQTILRNRSHPGGYLALAQAEAATGDFEASLESLARLAVISPQETHGWSEIASIALGSGHPEVARKAIAEALWRGRRDPFSLSNAAKLLEKMEDVWGSRLALDAACRLRPEDPDLHSKLGELSDRIGDERTSLKAWTRAAQIDPDNLDALEGAASAHWGSGNRQKALEMWERALQLDPGRASVEKGLARGYLESGAVQRGLNLYLSAMQSDPYDALLALEAGEAALRNGAESEAVQILEAAVELDRDSGEAWASLGEGYVAIGRWSEAAAALEQASSRQVASPRLAALHSISSLENGDLAAAKDWLNQAAELEAQGAHDAIWLARASLRLGNWNLAADGLEPWLSVDAAPAVVLEDVARCVRTCEAEWLYRAADAYRAAPSQDQLAPDWYQSAKHRLELIPAPNDAQAKSLMLRAAAAGQTAGAETLEALEAHAVQTADPQAAESLAIAKLRRGSPEGAIQALMIATTLPYAGSWAHLIRSMAYRTQGENEAAVAELELAGNDASLRPLAEAMVAGILSDSGQLEAAAAKLNRALATWPGEAAWHRQLGEIYLQQDSPDTALPHFQQAVELEPDRADHRLSLAKSLKECGHLDQAYLAFETALEDTEGTPDDFVAAAEAALASGNADRAFEWFERASTLSPSDLASVLGSARAASARGDHRQASERLEAAMRLEPRHPEVYLTRAEILASSGDLDGSLKALEKAEIWGLQSSDLFMAKSKTLGRLGRSDEAAQALRSALDLSPEHPSLWFELAASNEATGDFAAAAEAASKAVRFAPLSADYRLTLGRLSRKTGNLDRALDELNRASELNPAHPAIPLELGQVHEDRREYPSALQAYQQAIDLDASCTQAFYRSGLILRTLKAYREAGQMLKRAAELAPVDRDVLHQLAAVRALELVHGGTIHQQGATA